MVAPQRCGSCSSLASNGLEMGVAIVGTTSHTNSPVAVLTLIDTASIRLCSGLLVSNNDKLHGVDARVLTSFSVRKDRCDPTSNKTLASHWRLVPTTVAIAVFSSISRQVV